MAGVKTTRGGPRKETSWTVRECVSCGKLIEKHPEAYRIRSIWWADDRRRSSWAWIHRAHIGAGGK